MYRMKTNRIAKQALGTQITGAKLFLDARRKAGEFKYTWRV
jgi:hypothetical protein